MAPEDRDRNFEKALTRHLRASAPRGAGESAVSKMAACPDAETLAAFHERSLLPEEWDRVNLHVAGCSHCMTLLAQLEATEAIPLEAHSVAESQAQALAVPAAARVATTAAATSAPPGKSRRVLRLPGARWHYLAPAGALAAGLLVWIGVRENHSPDFTMKRSVQVAENRAAAPASPPLSAPVPNAASEGKAKAAEPFVIHSEPPAKARTADATKPAVALDDLSKDQTLSARNDAGAALSEKESKLKKEGVHEAAADAIHMQAGAGRDQKVGGGAVQQEVEALQAQVQNNTQNQTNSNLPRVPGPAPLGQAAMNRAAAAKPAPSASGSSAAEMPPPPPSQTATTGGQTAAPIGTRKAIPPAAASPTATQPAASGAAASNYTTSNSTAAALETVAGFANPRLITVPGSSLAWRVGRTGIIEFSRNDGSSWTRQSSGVSADLLTGSAPSDKTCWIVGRAGTVLLTTDGGAHWKLLKPPFAEDFGGIRATDMLHATVWNARNTLNYQTTDGGATWAPVPNP